MDSETLIQCPPRCCPHSPSLAPCKGGQLGKREAGWDIVEGSVLFHPQLEDSLHSTDRTQGYIMIHGCGHFCEPLRPLKKKLFGGNSLAVQWLGLYTFNAVGAGSIPGQGIKILKKKNYLFWPWHGQKKNYFLQLPWYKQEYIKHIYIYIYIYICTFP